MRRGLALSKAAEAAQGLADALRELATAEQTAEPSKRGYDRGEAQRRRNVRIHAGAPTVVDEVTAKRAQAALRRAGIVTR